MARGRRNAKREAARARQIEAFDLADRERQNAENEAAVNRRLTRKWRDARSGLDRLSTISRDLERLHREEVRLLRERDQLVQWLRGQGQSWVTLSARTGLSRQALMKRAVPAASSRER